MALRHCLRARINTRAANLIFDRFSSITFNATRVFDIFAFLVAVTKFVDELFSVAPDALVTNFFLSTSYIYLAHNTFRKRVG